jgi:hypothetical protein
MLISFLEIFVIRKCYQTLLGKKIKNVSPILADYVFATTSFNLWMSKGTHDGFALVVIF